MGWEGGGGHTYFLEDRLRLSNPQIVGVAQHLNSVHFAAAPGPLAAANLQTFFFSLSLSPFALLHPPPHYLSPPPLVCALAPSTSLQETETRQRRPKKIRLLTDKR